MAHEGHLEPGQRFDDTAPVERVSADSFKIPIPASWSYPVHPGGLSSLQLIDATGSERGTTRLLLAWRPVFNRGVVERVERVPSSDDDPRSLGRLRVYSRSNGLSPGARIWLTGIPGLDRDTHRVDNVATGLAGRRGYFEILVPKTHIENSLHKNPLQEIGGKLPEDREDYPPQNMKRWGVVGLFDDQELLGNWSDACQERWLNRRRETAREGSAPVIPPRPKLAIVTVSGGGIRSAFWTAVVLRELERRVPDFPWQLRLVTGASGGMLGAAHYVSSLQRPSDTSEQEPIHVLTDGTPISTDELIEHMAGDHLSRVANQLAFADLASMLIPFAWGRDRGQALETTWWRNTGGIGRSPLESPLRGLAVGEWEGWRPSLVFTPMLVEDGRRILISNLNLDYAPRNVGQILFARGTDKLSRNVKQSASYLKPGWDIYSLSAVEFYRVFPDAHEFRVSTAARMSAAFPLVTPAVSLPTIPPRRVVDAGYYDNYGVNLAATWVFQNRASLLDSTSGVVLIQIRDSQTERLRRELEDPEPVESNNLLARLFRTTPSSSRALDMFNDVAAKMHRGSQWLTSPLEGLSAARQSNMSFRNDEQMEILHNVFNIWRDSPVRGRGFCTTVVFECPREASLSWTITPREREDIRRGFDPDRIDPSYSDNARKNLERLNSLLEWWNR